MTLNNMHILITRPEPENTQSSQFFRDMGIKVTALPMMAIKPLDEPSVQSRIQSHFFDLDMYNKVIFVSKNAVRHGLEWIDHCWPQLPIGIEWIGIGEGTTALLNSLGHELGVVAQAHPQLTAENGDNSTSEVLLKQTNFQQVNNEKILILRGDGGRTVLASTLKERGASVNSLALYKREKITYSLNTITAADLVDVICVTSAEGLENLIEILTFLDKNWFNKTIITPSQRVAERAKDFGWTNVINAHGADDNRLMSALIQL